MLHSAIDFHCYPKLINECRDLHSQFTVKQIKRAVWIHRSSITNKALLCNPEKPIILFTSFTKRPENDHEEVTNTWKKIEQTWLNITKPKNFWISPNEEEGQNNKKRKIEPAQGPKKKLRMEQGDNKVQQRLDSFFIKKKQ
jgi:hypothetical protein